MVIGVNGTSGRNALQHAATGQNLERGIAPILPHITAGNFALATTRKSPTAMSKNAQVGLNSKVGTINVHLVLILQRNVS